MQYDDSQQICARYFAEEPKGHLDHKFCRLSVQRVIDLPDDTKIQVMIAWRCSAMNCTLGKPWLTRLQDSTRVPFHTKFQKLTTTPVSHKIRWLHEHLDARWYIGDAVTDLFRMNVVEGCIKTTVYRKQLVDLPKSTKMKCGICKKGQSLHMQLP